MNYSDWTDVRIAVLGKWAKKPDWCCIQIMKYLGKINKCKTDKLIQAENYLNSKLIMNEVKAVENLKFKITNELIRRNKNDTRRNNK